MSNGKFVWFEYVTTDTAKAKGFFGELFGWGTQEVPMPDGPYAMIAAGDRTIGGYLPTPEGAPRHAHWLSHLQVADAKATADKVVKLGGKVLKGVTKVGDFGTMAIVADPHGGVLSLWQPTRPEPAKEATTNTFCWNELASSDPAKSVEFYTAIGGTTATAMDMGPMGTYHVLSANGQHAGGIMAKAMPQQPHAWLPYVQVASTDKIVDKATKLGGNVVVPPADIPDVGRFAIIADTQGAPLGVLQPPAGR